jgi:hypothetical protein
MRYHVVYELGGPGTLTKRGFTHFKCLPAKFNNHKGEPVTMDRYRRVFTEEQAVEHTCMMCQAKLTEPSQLPV